MQPSAEPNGELASALQLKGRTRPWGPWALALLAGCVALGLWLRLKGLADEGFSDDELHKWLAANRYLVGDFGGDDLEHPMVMKSLIALALIVGRQLQWAPETITRLPNALGGGLAVLVLALLGRRLFGRAAGLLAAALGAVSVTWIGYQRIAKEDVLTGLFLMLLWLCLAEAKASADVGEDRRSRRFEWGAAAALSATIATKYYPYFLFPVVAVLSFGRTQTAYRVPLKRWIQLAFGAVVIWICLNWMIVFPSTWKYIYEYLSGAKHGGRATHMTMLFMGRLYQNVFHVGSGRMPTSFFPVFRGQANPRHLGPFRGRSGLGGVEAPPFAAPGVGLDGCLVRRPFDFGCQVCAFFRAGLSDLLPPRCVRGSWPRRADSPVWLRLWPPRRRCAAGRAVDWTRALGVHHARAALPYLRQSALRRRLLRHLVFSPLRLFRCGISRSDRIRGQARGAGGGSVLGDRLDRSLLRGALRPAGPDVLDHSSRGSLPVGRNVLRRGPSGTF